MFKKNILLVTSKHPESRLESDGGKSTIRSVINSLKGNYNLDILFIREFNENESRIEGVRKVLFEKAKFNSDNKFERRIINREQICSRIINLSINYDHIVIIHVSKAFGLDNAPEDIKKKIILYPMFLACKYIESGEDVPNQYINLEEQVLKSIDWFVCPSEYDKQVIINMFDRNPDKIAVIPRSVDSSIVHTPRKFRKGYKILCIGNIKERKQPLRLLEIFLLILKKYPTAELFFAGEIQDIDLYKRCIEYININRISEKVHFLGVLSTQEISRYIDVCDINVTASNLETFGRCVFEGLYGGLPTVIYDKLECVLEFVEDNKGVLVSEDDNQFYKNIDRLFCDDNGYAEQSLLSVNSTNFLSFEAEKLQLLEFIKKIEEDDIDGI